MIFVICDFCDFPNILMLRQHEKKKKKSKLLTTSGLDFLSGLLDSNQRPRAPQTCALPTALNPDPFQVTSFEIGCKGTALFRYLQIFN